MRDTWIVSNRGPGEYRPTESGGEELTWQPGGLSMVLIPPAMNAAQGSSGGSIYWLAAAKTPGDVAHADDGVLETKEAGQPVHLRFLALSPEEERLYYGVFANTVLWTTHHGIEHDLTDDEVGAAWETYRAVNQRFADYVVDHVADGAVVQVHDFQLALCGAMISQRARERGRRIDVVGFWHIAFAEIDELLHGFRESRAAAPRTAEFLESLGTISWGFHRDVWAERFCAAHSALLGRRSAAPTFVMPAYVDVVNLRTESRRREVAAAMDVIYEELREINNGRSFWGSIIGAVGRADPKNGMDRLLDAYALVLDQHAVAEPPALVMNVAPSRLDVTLYREHWQSLLDKKAAIEARHPEARILLRYNVTRNGTPTGKPRADAVATFRIAHVVAVFSRAGGRDIVGQEAVALKMVNRGDRPSVAVLSAEAGTSDTLTGIVRDGTLHPGALVVHDIGPQVPEAIAAERCAHALTQALTMSATEVNTRFAVMNELLDQEDPDVWYAELMLRSQEPADGPRRYERGDVDRLLRDLAPPIDD